MKRLFFPILPLVLVLDLAVSLLVWPATGAWLASAYPPPVCIDGKDTGNPGAVLVFFTDTEADLAVRMEAASRRLGDCPAETVYLLGGARPHLGYFGAGDMAMRLERKGVSRDRMRIDLTSYSTRTNLDAALGLISREPAPGYVLVQADRLQAARIIVLLGGRLKSVPVGIEVVEPDQGFGGKIRRFHYEATAWFAEILPQAWREAVFRAIGRRPAANAQGKAAAV